jgi:hypothetical protein
VITYNFNNEQNFLDVVFSDMIDPSEILNFMKDINNKKDLPRKLNVILDVREADFIFEPITIQNIVKANFRMNKSFQKINNAILANNPEDATLSMFNQYTRDSKNYHVKMFSDGEKALSWFKKM